MTSDLYHALIDLTAAHANFAYGIIFLLAFSEAIPVIGTFVPGSTLVFAVSALATKAGASPWLLLVGAVLGAIAGDGISFWFGHYYSRAVLHSWPLVKYPKFIDQSEKFIARWGIAAVFLARFTAVVRAFVPLLAGILEMPARSFYAANIISAVVWAPAHVFPGVVLAMLTGLRGAIAEQPVILIVAGVVVLSFVFFGAHWWLKAKIK
jgi:membrane protein DedA with SNARE-associated domain